MYEILRTIIFFGNHFSVIKVLSYQLSVCGLLFTSTWQQMVIDLASRNYMFCVFEIIPIENLNLLNWRIDKTAIFRRKLRAPFWSLITTIMVLSRLKLQKARLIFKIKMQAFCSLMRLYVERWKRRTKLSHLIRAESNRRGEGDRCIRDEISSVERASHGSCWNINSARSFCAGATLYVYL